ncbi:MAG: deoxyribodipyrimidine photo-lyase/cryptochrome family protein [Moraxellaceae bacterium]|nr:deoxyribodipyrimidine photo-lyase/cryptochrome family protein [Moraxellaceae bacterium]
MPVQIVWFKRDLRAARHAALAVAATHGPVLGLYVREPSVWCAPDASARQWGFVRESLQELRAALAALGVPLLVTTAELLPVLRQLHDNIGIGGLWAHEETGNALTFARDVAVAGWCREQGIAFRECRQYGVIRGLTGRRHRRWAGEWERFMATPLPATMAAQVAQERPSLDLPAQSLHWREPDIAGRQPGGRRAGLTALTDFLGARVPTYRRGMSSPLSAAQACSRLSPYIAWGCLSLAEVDQATCAAIDTEAALPTPLRTTGRLASLRAFRERLAWHCHFIQKLETEPSLEFRNMHSGYDGLREGEFRADVCGAWARGETGWPLVDACMKSLTATGWLNFRMRAMLMSVAAYPLWLHWREPALVLARLFTDYEPGIHFAQAQMQSGVTGINAMRVYHPTKQARDQDPDGVFIRRWLPALANVPASFLAEPWRMPRPLQQKCGVVLGRDYPEPLTDLDTALRCSKTRMAERRASLAGSAETRRVVERLASRRRADHTASRARPRDGNPAPQLNLEL